MPLRRSSRRVSSLAGAKRPAEDILTPPATQESQIPVPVPKKRGRGRPPRSSQFTIAEDTPTTEYSQQFSQQASQPSQKPPLRENPFITNRQADKIPWNTPPADYKPLSVPHREPKIQLPKSFNEQQIWRSPAAFFDLYLPEALLDQIAENTNEYWRQNAREDCLRSRAWVDTTTGELYGFIAVQVLMGLVGNETYEQFWTHGDRSYYKQIQATLSLRRYELLQQFFHITTPERPADDAPPADLPPEASYRSVPERLKVSLLDNHIRTTTQRVFTPSSELAIDEMTQLFVGRSMYTMALPNKPAGEGFKAHALADSQTNIILDWRYAEKKHITGINPYWSSQRFAGRHAVVLELTSHLPRVGKAAGDYCIYLDNYYTAKKLYTRLRDEGIGAHGTANTAKLVDVHPELAALKYNTKMPWGSFKATHEDGVLQVCWQDSVPTLFMSTVDTASTTVKKDRWRPPKASSKAAMDDWERQGEPASNRLGHRRVDLPTFADRYNNNMNAVDVANQNRDAYATRRPHWRGWKALWHLLLDLAITNAWKLQKLQQAKLIRLAEQCPLPHPAIELLEYNHKRFREVLVEELLQRVERVGGRHSWHKQPMFELVQPVERHLHMQGKVSESTCSACVAYKRQAPGGYRRQGNIADETAKQRLRGRAKRTIYACLLCKINICPTGTCWEDHLQAVDEKRRALDG